MRIKVRGLLELVWLMLLLGCGPMAAQSMSDLTPFAMDHRRAALAHSPVDVSFLLDAPAGRHGFLKVKDGHLATGDGERIRLWGVNITDWSKGSRQIPAKEDAALWAGTLARFGVNCVRLQFLDLKAPRGLIEAGIGNTRMLDAAQLDREDYFLTELEKRGIYIDLNLLVGRPFEDGDGVKDAKVLREGAKGTSFYDARMLELQKEYAQQLLQHLNPYTRKKYIDDPAIAIVEINNENAINVGFHAPSPFYEQELQGIYNDWLTKHRSGEQIAQLRMLAGVAQGAPVPLIGRRGESAQTGTQRFHTEAEFYDNLQRNYFAEMKQYVKETLGSKSLVIATADHNHAASGYPVLFAMNGMDAIDGHTYWQHPEYYVHKLPMVNDPLNSTVAELSRSAIRGMPYTVSEVNNPFPNDYAGEGIPILAAYGSLQDWDAILWYTFEPKIEKDWKPYVGDPFDISLDPVKMAELASGALMFLRGDVAKARETRERSYSQDQVFDSMILPTTDRPYFTPGYPPYQAMEHELRISTLSGSSSETASNKEGTNESTVPDPIVSDTGELKWYWPQTGGDKQAGLVTVDSPRTEALIGFTIGRSVSHLAMEVSNLFCTVQLTSMDEAPIASSSKMLLVAGGAVENTGQTWNTAGTDVTAWGEAPTRIDVVRGTLTLRTLKGARGVSLQALDGAGQPLGAPVPAVHSGEDWQVKIGNMPTTWYEIAVQH